MVAPSGCEIAIAGRHAGSAGRIEVRFDESQVRIQTGWWASLARGGSVARRVLEPGDSFEEAFELRQGCNPQRRYRLVFAMGGTTHTHEYPSSDGFTRDQSFDVGHVNRFFGIADGPPTDVVAETETETRTSSGAESTVTVGGVQLNGAWIRKESTNDPNDGMRVVVRGSEAVLTYVPASALSAWEEGDVLWKDIASNGAVNVLGSNNRHYPGRFAFEGRDLHLDVGRGGAGAIQTWVRVGDCWSNGEAVAEERRADDIWVRYSDETPAGLQTALRDARDHGAAIQTLAVTSGKEWVVVAGNAPCYSPGFPGAARAAIDGYTAQGREVDVVAFGPGGRWLVVAEDLLRRSTNVSLEINERIRATTAEGTRLTSFAFSDQPDRDWHFTAGGRASHGTTENASLNRAINAARQGARTVHHIDIGPDGRWVMLAENWFVTLGLPRGLLGQMDSYRTDHIRRMDHVVLFGSGSDAGWIIVSNGTEPVPNMGQRPQMIETRMPGDSTIYQKMQQYGIVGLSIAVVDDNQIAWARGYGLRDIDDPESFVYPNTVFDAASISKPLVGAGVLRLVEDNDDLSLTATGVLRDLEGPLIPAGAAFEAIRPDEISLAHLMNHCAGLDHASGASGAQPMSVGATLPSYAAMFAGQSPAGANQAIVPIDTVEVGERFDYSGANALLLQALIQRHAEGGFDAHMERLFDDLNMSSSTYRTDFASGPLIDRFAYGHGMTATGEITKNNNAIFPNQAAAGLRTTALDLGHFIIMLNQEGAFLDRAVLTPERFEQFVGRDGIGDRTGVSEGACDAGGRMRLHIYNSRPSRTNRSELVFHGGVHNNYRTFFYALPNEEEGVAIMITGEWDDLPSGSSNLARFARELRNAMRPAYSWPALP